MVWKLGAGTWTIEASPASFTIFGAVGPVPLAVASRARGSVRNEAGGSTGYCISTSRSRGPGSRASCGSPGWPRLGPWEAAFSDRVFCRVSEGVRQTEDVVSRSRGPCGNQSVTREANAIKWSRRDGQERALHQPAAGEGPAGSEPNTGRRARSSTPLGPPGPAGKRRSSSATWGRGRVSSRIAFS